MQLTVRNRNGAVQDVFREYAEKKVNKLERYFHHLDSARVEQALVRGVHIVELNLEGDGVILRSEERCGDMYAAIDNAVEKLERQVVRFKGRKRDGRQRPGPLKEAAASKAVEVAETEYVANEPDDNHELRITRRKRFPMKPMSADEAAMQMELVDHAFFLFLNEDTGEVSVLYRRRAGDYGLIEPES